MEEISDLPLTSLEFKLGCRTVSNKVRLWFIVKKESTVFTIITLKMVVMGMGNVLVVRYARVTFTELTVADLLGTPPGQSRNYMWTNHCTGQESCDNPSDHRL